MSSQWDFLPYVNAPSAPQSTPPIYRPNITLENPLPPAEELFVASYNMAWPQILAFCGAATGILLAVWVVRSFIARG